MFQDLDDSSVDCDATLGNWAPRSPLGAIMRCGTPFAVDPCPVSSSRSPCVPRYPRGRPQLRSSSIPSQAMRQYPLVVLFSMLCGGLSFALPQIQFAPALSLAVGSKPEGGTLLDYDGDQDLDLAVTSESPDKIEFFTNAGDGTFALGFVLPTGNATSPEGLAAADFDGDGDLDVVMALFSAGQVRIALGNGNGQFVLAGSYPAGQEPSMVVAPDFNGDGKPDAAVNNRVSGDVSVYLNDGLGGLIPMGTYAVGAETRSLAAGDLTGDGWDDLAVSSRDDHRVRLFQSLGNGTFQTLVDLGFGTILKPHGVAIADFDHDGALDVATACTGNLLTEVVGIHVQNNGGNHWVGPVNGSTGGLSPSGLAAADFDLDGIPDVAVANADSDTITAMRSSGIAGIFYSGSLQFPVGQNPEALIVVAGDLDGNTTPDVVTFNRDSDDASILINLQPRLPAAYCTAKINSSGCLPLIRAIGSPSLAAPANFFVQSYRLVVQQNGLTFFGLNGPDQVPFQDGLLCVKPPLYRLAIKNTTGSTPCQGSLTHTLSEMLAHPSGGGFILAGQLVCCQSWYRDSLVPSTTGLSGGLKFEVLP